MEKIQQLRLREMLNPLCLGAVLLWHSPGVQGEENPPYLPRLGPLPIRFLVPPPTPPPFLLPPLDLGDEETGKDDDSKKNTDEENDREASSIPERRVRVSEMSSRPSAESGSAGTSGPNQVQGSEFTGPAAPGGGVEALLPDGFDLNFDQSGTNRRDLSVFLNYFIGQGQRGKTGQSDATTHTNSAPKPTVKAP